MSKKFYIFVRMNPPEGEQTYGMDSKRVYGPFDSSMEAHAYGLPFAEEGFDVEAHVDEPVCDFCSSTEIAWGYTADDFAVGGMGWGSRGGWAACEICHGLIEANEREALAAHSLEEFYKHNAGAVPDTKPVRAALLAHIFRVHSMFFASRTGKASHDTSEFKQS